MRVKYTILVVVVFLSSKAHCFKNGYSKETCDDMIPKHEPGEPNVTLSSSKCSYNFEAKSEKYRRNRELEISITGKDIKGFQLQFRKTGSSKIERVGEFVSVPDGAKFLQCDDGENTAITNKDLEPKTELSFKWQAPKDDEGIIELKSSFVSADKYWTDCSDLKLECADLPVSVQDCGVNKSCVRCTNVGSDCDGNTCRYLLTYHKSGDRTVTFSLSGLSKEQNSYTAVGFKKEEDGNIGLTVCFKNDDGVDIKYYIFDESKGFYETTGELEDKITDSEGSNFWCQFSRPVPSAGTSALDFDTEIGWVYTWGIMNTTTNQPILNNSTWYKARRNISELINFTFHISGSNSIPMTGFIPIFLSSLSLLILQM